LQVSGAGGAQEAAKHLEDQGISLHLIIDEGGIILADGLKGLVNHPLVCCVCVLLALKPLFLHLLVRTNKCNACVVKLKACIALKMM